MSRFISKENFLKEIIAQGQIHVDNIAFVCPDCGAVQSAMDFKHVDVLGWQLEVGVNCIGRYDRDFPVQKNKNGDEIHACNLSVHNYQQKVDFGNGDIRPYFRLATASEAQSHAISQFFRTKNQK